jgi:hypothetical protein
MGLSTALYRRSLLSIDSGQFICFACRFSCFLLVLPTPVFYRNAIAKEFDEMALYTVAREFVIE